MKCSRWAYRGIGTENTRDSIYDAMQRKEVYATTGQTRWRSGFSADGTSQRMTSIVVNWLLLVTKGVPMGDDIEAC